MRCENVKWNGLDTEVIDLMESGLELDWIGGIWVDGSF